MIKRGERVRQDNRNDKESFQEPLQKCITRTWSAQSPGQETLTRYLDGSGAAAACCSYQILVALSAGGKWRSGVRT